MSVSFDGAEALRFGDVTARRDLDGVAWVEVHRPPNNFFDVQLISALADSYEALEVDGRSRVIILCSEGKNFCAGAEFAPRVSSFERSLPFSVSDLYREGSRLFGAALPVVAAVQGAAVGGGLGLACSADFRVASRESRFCANFAQLGFHQGFGLSVSLPGIVGQQRAWDLMLTGRRIDGIEALGLGLCDSLVDDVDIRGEALRLAREIATSAPLAVRSIRSTLRRPLLERLDEALTHEAHEQDALRETEDFKEGVRAMHDRRTPKFSGR